MKIRSFVLVFVLVCQFSKSHSQLYFPPISGGTWDTLHPDRFGWCSSKIDELYNYLDQTNTDAFILMKDGKIVLEKYYGTFTKDSLHTWNSAGKTLMAALVGIAQKENLLDIDLPTSTYLGTGWTNLPSNQEINILLKHNLTMTTGLDDTDNLDCTDPNCLNYMANPGTRWSYHNAPYTLIGSVIENASSVTLNNYTNSKIGSKIGMNGIYFPSGYNRVFVSTPRSMARFGLLMLANGNWDGTTVLGDQAYLTAMTSSSQNMNLSYGYLTWLNGKSSFMIPQSQFVFNGSAMPSAPNDVYAALGKNSQIINVSPSNNMVLVRMGDGDGVSLVSTQYNDSIWRRINNLECSISLQEKTLEEIEVFPNPSMGEVHITNLPENTRIEVSTALGNSYTTTLNNGNLKLTEPGIYLITIYLHSEIVRKKILIL